MATPRTRLTTAFPVEVAKAIENSQERTGKSQNQTIVDLVTAGLKKERA